MAGRERTLGVTGGRAPAEKLELICRESASGTVEIELRLLAWGEGVGWYPQRTLPLPGNLAQLRTLLRRAEAVSRRGAARGTGARLLHFPLPDAGAAGLARPASA